MRATGSQSPTAVKDYRPYWAGGAALPPIICFTWPITSVTTFFCSSVRAEAPASCSKVANPAELREVASELLARYHQPVLVETFLPGREFTVGLAGRGETAEVLGMIEVNFKAGSGEIYSYQTKTDYETLVTYTVPDDAVAREAAQVALAAWRALRCVDAGRADIRCDAAGRPNFIEVNPLAGLNPTHSDLPILCRMNGIDFTQLIGRIMTEARTRQGLDVVI